MGPLTEIFLSHMNTLRKLKQRIELLRQASVVQKDVEMTWIHVGKILETMDHGC